MTSRALTFGSVAADYERFRPGYPDEVVETVLSYAGRPVATALEIGAGTGKATRVFASHGVAVNATDPDAAMLAELVRHVPDSVRTVRAAFEDLPLTTTYDLVYAAAALHWTRPEGRWERVAALLEPAVSWPPSVPPGTSRTPRSRRHCAPPRRPGWTTPTCRHPRASPTAPLMTARGRARS